jgi:O-antigen ligase
LQALYRALQPAFESSVAAQLAFGVVESVPVAVSWLMLLVMVFPYEHWNNAYSFAGFVFCGVLTVFAGMRKGDWRILFADFGPWLVAFAAMVVVAWPMSAYPSQSARFLLFHLTCMLCVVILVSCVERRDQLMRLVTFACLALAVMGAAGCIQRIQGVEVNPSYVDQTLNEGMPGRVYAFYENPNAFGEVLLLLIPLAVALMLCSKGWLGRLIGFGSAALGCVAMAMTYSRAGWIGLAVAAVLFVVLWNRKLIPVGIVVAFLGLALLPDTVFHRILTIFNTSDTSTNSRFPYYYAAAEFLKMRPLQGAGLGTDAVRSAIADLNLFHGKDHFVHCHNIYLQVWCETGLLGLISFVGGILWTVKEGARAARRALCHPQTRMVVIGAISALLGTMVCGLADYIWNYPRVMLIFWFVCAIALSALRLAKWESRCGRAITD